MVSGDSSDDESEEESNGTLWGHTHYNIVVGSELGANVPSSPMSNPSQYQPILGGPFSALLQSMWPQDILSQIQQVAFLLLKQIFVKQFSVTSLLSIYLLHLIKEEIIEKYLVCSEI